jgi:bifunctional enzyme CysN/CysC/sulfate adenylyltransferase subunit 1
MSATVEVSRPRTFDEFLAEDLGKELLRFTTAGSVDDGKSTLIGRLLHDSKAVYEDQLAAVRNSRVNRSGKALDFALLTDGLRAEREQGITIDVAYRFFQTARRKFIIADTPGHEEYTRNMATGASTADLAVILIDATKGLLPQTRRHTYIAALLGVRHVVAAVNKLDLVGYREDVFLRLESEILALAAPLGIGSVRCIPISALEGDNVVERSARTPWYSGPSLIEYLETVPMAPEHEEQAALRFPVQFVLRPHAGFRGFAGQVAGGVLRPGDRVVALPSGRETRVRAIVTYDGELAEAAAPQSVAVTLEDEIDLSRGDLLVSPGGQPQISAHFVADVVWQHAQPFEEHHNYLLKHAGRVLRVQARRIRHRVDINSFAELPAQRLAMNEIGVVELEASKPLFFDAYGRNRSTGSFILIDPIANATVGAGMIREALRRESLPPAADAYINAFPGAITERERAARRGYPASVFLLEGALVASGLAERELFDRGFEAVALDARALEENTLRRAIELGRAAGLLVVIAADGLTRRQLRVITEVAGSRLIRIVAANANGSARELALRAAAAAEATRGVSPAADAQKSEDA